jgi:hypothetical protein
MANLRILNFSLRKQPQPPRANQITVVMWSAVKKSSVWVVHSKLVWMRYHCGVSFIDALVFLAEGFLPLLHVFYTECFDLLTCSQTDPKRMISEKIYDTLMVSGQKAVL